MKKLYITGALALGMTISANAAVHYVTPDGTGDGTSWANASSSIQDMINAASAGDQIWVKAGTYAPTSLIKSNKATSKAFIMKDGVSLYGGFAGTETELAQRAAGDKPYDMTNATILSADDAEPDTWTRAMMGNTTYRWGWEVASNNNIPGTKNNFTHLIYCEATFQQPTVVDGFTLTGGNANIYQAKANGGAVYALGTVSLSNCRIEKNSSYFSAETTSDSNSYGGAVYLIGGSMENCYIADTYCHSSYGSGLGGGVYAENATIKNCEFVNCYADDMGGGAYIKSGTLSGCTFTDCYSGSGGAIYLAAAGSANDITVTGCRSLKGGGAYNAGKLLNAVISNCCAEATEFNDGGLMGGGALYLKGGTASGIVAYNNTAYQGGGAWIDNGKLVNATILNNSVREGVETNPNVYLQSGTEADNVLNSIYDPATALSNFVKPTSFKGNSTDSEQAAAIASANWQLAPGSEFIGTGTAVTGFTDGNDPAGNPRMPGSTIDRGAYQTVAPVEKTPAIVLTFNEGVTSAKLGTGGASGYEFSIDWGNGEEETYNAQAYYTHAVGSDPVKIYGDGIELLYANTQGIATADFTNAPSIIQVQLVGNDMTSLTLGNHPSMTGIYASNNKIQSIDLSGAPNLRVIDLHENEIAGAIDCSAMNSLSKIDVADNKLTSLTLPKHSTVYEVDCSRNLLTSLDATGLSGLDELSASENQLTTIDLAGLTAMTNLYVDGNKLRTLDISPCQSLEKVMAAENQIESINLSKNKTLSGVYLQNNKLQSLDITANTNVRWLNVGSNNLSEINVDNQPNLSILIADNNNLSAVNLSNNSSISSLDLSHNNITAIDITKPSYLSQCHLEFNKLTELNTSKNSYLYGLFCNNNEISSLDISANTYLQRLEAQENKLSSLDISKNTGLQEILIQKNNLDETALNAMIDNLPDVNAVNVTDETKDFIRQLNISDMPGTPYAKVDAAKALGWFVTADFDPSGIENVATESEAATVEYVNAAGVRSDRPFNGVNIRVTTLSDGTVKTKKVIF